MAKNIQLNLLTAPFLRILGELIKINDSYIKKPGDTSELKSSESEKVAVALGDVLKSFTSIGNELSSKDLSFNLTNIRHEEVFEGLFIALIEKITTSFLPAIQKTNPNKAQETTPNDSTKEKPYDVLKKNLEQLDIPDETTLQLFKDIVAKLEDLNMSPKEDKDLTTFISAYQTGAFTAATSGFGSGKIGKALGIEDFQSSSSNTISEAIQKYLNGFLRPIKVKLAEEDNRLKLEQLAAGKDKFEGLVAQLQNLIKQTQETLESTGPQPSNGVVSNKLFTQIQTHLTELNDFVVQDVLSKNETLKKEQSALEKALELIDKASGPNPNIEQILSDIKNIIELKEDLKKPLLAAIQTISDNQSKIAIKQGQPSAIPEEQKPAEKNVEPQTPQGWGGWLLGAPLSLVSTVATAVTKTVTTLGSAVASLATTAVSAFTSSESKSPLVDLRTSIENEINNIKGLLSEGQRIVDDFGDIKFQATQASLSLLDSKLTKLRQVVEHYNQQLFIIRMVYRICNTKSHQKFKFAQANIEAALAEHSKLSNIVEKHHSNQGNIPKDAQLSEKAPSKLEEPNPNPLPVEQDDKSLRP